jgi:hypothetical protein
MTYENYIKGKLVSFCVDEAYHTGSPDVVLGIAQTLKNRVDAGWCGGDWKQVIETAPDYVGTLQENRPEIDPRDVLFRRILGAIDDVYYGIADAGDVNVEGPDETKVSLYYAELHNLNRQWFKDSITNDLESHPRIAKVGSFDFFA